MSVASFYKCHDRIWDKCRKLYNVNYCLYSYKYSCENRSELLSLRSYSPGKGNATRLLRLLVHMAKKHNVKIYVRACSYNYNPVGEHSTTPRERYNYYWRALLMYQRAGFKIVNKETFVRDSEQQGVIELIST